MKTDTLKLISCFSVFFLLLSSLTACASPSVNAPESSVSSVSSTPATDETTVHHDPEESFRGSESESAPLAEPDESEPFLADLNNDGIDDQIFITFEDADKTAATLQIVNGKDASELMSESLSLTKNTKGAFYLKIGKTGYFDELVFWSYHPLETGGMVFRYSVFSFNADGEIQYQEQEDYRFQLGNSIQSENMVFLTMREAINAHIVPNHFSHDSYLLFDNLGCELQYSTKDSLITPQKLTLTLNDFVSE